MESVGEAFALVREARDLAVFVVDDTCAAETDAGDSGEVNIGSSGEGGADYC